LRRFVISMGLAVAASASFSQQAPSAPPLLLQHPSLSATQVAFDYAGEIWTVPRDGGRATRLVTGQGQLSGPIFSPDGTRVAFTGRYDGNTDVYVVAAGGGEPTRLTWHPGADVALAWTPDGKSILLRSPRRTPRDLDQLYLVPASGGPERELPLPSGEVGSFSPDGSRLAYAPYLQWEPAWKQYRGGQTARLWLADLATSHVTEVPRDNSNDTNPMWVGDTLYFTARARSTPTTSRAAP
jgi:tricorn protease